MILMYSIPGPAKWEKRNHSHFKFPLLPVHPKTRPGPASRRTNEEEKERDVLAGSFLFSGASPTARKRIITDPFNEYKVSDLNNNNREWKIAPLRFYGPNNEGYRPPAFLCEDISIRGTYENMDFLWSPTQQQTKRRIIKDHNSLHHDVTTWWNQKISQTITLVTRHVCVSIFDFMTFLTSWSQMIPTHVTWIVLPHGQHTSRTCYCGWHYTF